MAVTELFTEDVFDLDLPDGYSKSVNWFTGDITIKSPYGSKFTVSPSYSGDKNLPKSNVNVLGVKKGSLTLIANPDHDGATYYYDASKINTLESQINKELADNGVGVTYSMWSQGFSDASGNWLGTKDVNKAATNAQANAAAAAAEAAARAEAEAKAAEAEAKANAVANANSSNAIIKRLLNGNMSGLLGRATSAKQNFTISKADYAALRAKYPNYSDEQLAKLISDSNWANNFGASLSADKTTSDLKGDLLAEFIATAEEGNDATKTRTNAELTKQREALLKQIENDPELYNAIVSQFRGDSANGIIAGQRAANALDVSRKANNTYKASADELYKSIGGTGEDSLAGQTRSAIYNNLTGAYGGYTEQQLNTLARDMNLQTEDVKELITALSIINQGLQSEDAQVQRAAADELARIQREATDRESKASQQSAVSIAGANAAANDASTQAALASDIVGNTSIGLDKDEVLKATSNKSTNYGGGTYNKAKYEDAPYIDENLLKTLLGPDYRKFLTDKTFDRFTTALSEETLARQYGLEDLLNVDNVTKQYLKNQQQANEASDKIFNDAQRAYVMAIAAGDEKTAEQLTRLAQTAGTSRKNLYGTTALANQFAQQRANANVSNDLYYDSVKQQAANRAANANAIQAGRAQWNQWVGDGNPNASGNGFSKSYAQHVGNTKDAKGAYGDLIGAAMSNQSKFNDAIGNVNRGSNNTLSDYAAALNRLNANGAAANTNNSAAIAGIKNTLGVQQLINNATINKNS